MADETPTQAAVRLRGEGLSVRRIAQGLGLSTSTIYRYLSSPGQSDIKPPEPLDALDVFGGSRGRHEASLRRAAEKSAEFDFDDPDMQYCLSLSILADQLIAAQPITMYGDTKFAYHLKAVLAELGRALDRALLTPQSRLTIRDADEMPDPFAEVKSNVTAILRG